MKRTPIRRRTPMPPRSSPLPKEGTSERRKKTEARRRKQRRETDGKDGRMETLTRDDFRCTAIIERGDLSLRYVDQFATGTTEPESPNGNAMRCRWKSEDGSDLHEHHVRYRKPSIRVTLCTYHHMLIEGLTRPWNRYRRGRAS